MTGVVGWFASVTTTGRPGSVPSAPGTGTAVAAGSVPGPAAGRTSFGDSPTARDARTVTAAGSRGRTTGGRLLSRPVDRTDVTVPEQGGDEELECAACGKTFPDEQALHDHLYAEGLVD